MTEEGGVERGLAFLDGGGEAARLIHARRWSDHPLGPPEGWPTSLRTALSLVLNAPEPMILAWGGPLFFFFNTAYMPLLGPRVERAMGEPFADVWADAWAQARPIVEDALAGRPRRFQDTPWRLDTDRGAAETWWSFSYSRVMGDDGRPVGLFIHTEETTSRVLSEVRRREEETRNRQVLDSALDYAIVATDLEGRVTRWNAGAGRMLGWSEAAMLGESLERILPPGERDAGRLEAERRAALAGGRDEGEGWRLRASGERFWAEGGMTRLLDAEGEAVGFVKVLKDKTAEHAAAEAVEELEARLGRAQQAGGVGVFSMELADDRVDGSREFRRIFGLDDHAPLTNGDVLALIDPRDIGVAYVSELAEQRPLTPRVEYRIRHGRTGEERVIARRAELERDEAGRPLRMVGVVQDITERRLAQRELEESEARFRAFAEAVPNHVWSAAPDGHMDWANRRGLAYTGQSHADLLATGWRRNVHPDDLPAALATWSACLRAGADLETEFRIRRADGAYRWHLVRAVPLHDGEGRVTGWIGSNTDIHDRKAAAEALQRLNEELEERVAARTQERDRMWRLSRDLFLIVGRDGLYKAVNPAWERELGWAPSELEGLPFDALVHPDDRALVGERFAALIDGAPSMDLSCRLRGADGEHRETTWSAVATASGFYCIGRDVTEQRRTEEALRQAQKMEAVGQLTGGLAHDFNNLLAGVSGALELLETRLAQGRAAEAGRYVAAAQGAARRAAALTHRLLAFSRRQTLDPRPTDVNGLVAGMEDLIRRTVGPAVQVEVVGAAGLWATLVDPPQLENALLNLCINARDAMPAGGRLTIETANRAFDEADARLYDLKTDEYVVLSVSDTGVGMPPEVVAKAFDPFFTTKPLGEGTGLGLSMIYGFAKQSGGQARIYSEAGAGATVRLFLPRHRGEAAATLPSSAAQAAARARAGETVLVVDDEPTVRMLVLEVLNELGYLALEAEDGPGGLAILQSDARVDLLVTDVGLPGGLNGRRMAEAARVSRPGLKVLFITGYAENAALHGGRLEPGTAVLTKPFAMSTLARRVHEMIGSDVETAA